MSNAAQPAAKRAAKKRPAAKRPSADTENKARLRQPRKAHTWYHAVPGAEAPNWARHFADILDGPLKRLALPQKLGKKANLKIWSDCAGKCTELYAARSIADELSNRVGVDLEFNLYGGSDNCHWCREFVQSNCSPQHFSADIFKRDFEACTFECVLCQGMCALPRLSLIHISEPTRPY